MHVIEGGFKPVRAGEIASIIEAINDKKIGPRALRVYFAAHVAVAARQAATFAPSRKKAKGPKGSVRHSAEELARLSGLSIEATKKELRALSRAELLSFSETEITFGMSDSDEVFDRSPRRIIPMPRRLLRYLARCDRKAELLTILGYCVRGLSRRGGEISTAGTAKAGWIAKHFGISVRSVRAERGRLIAAKFISEDNSTQRKLNRTGAYFRINPAWTGPAAGCDSGRAEKGARELAQPAAAPGSRSEIASPQVKNQRCFAPPIGDKKTPYGSRNQKPRATPKPAGVSSKHEKNTHRVILPPTIKAVQADDLASFGRTEALYWQAVGQGILTHSEASSQRWIAAAVRAKSGKGVGDPVRVFMGIVRKGLWHHITQADEERAVAGLKKYREANPHLYRNR